MDLIPAVLGVEHERSHHHDVASYWWKNERVVVTHASRNGICLCDRVLADGFEDEISGLVVDVGLIKAGLTTAVLAGVNAKPYVIVTVGLSGFRLDRAAHSDARR